ncbi:apolipoprotein N-acyltransferase [Hyphobacterium sp. CCMP332]|nr:apolipoprotein N-acyltransferase [Hyphobacterium sp. CCMP332]
MQATFFQNWNFLDKKLNRWILTVFSSTLLSVSWPIHGFPFLIFFAFIPILILNEKFDRSRNGAFYLHVYTAFLIWNVLTTYWVYNSTPVAILAFTANSLLQMIPIFAFRMTFFRANRNFSFTALPIYWISFEYLHLTWQLSWPWLTLGNVFSEYPEIVQWYEYTGVLGGSLWIWVVNIMTFTFINRYKDQNQKFPRLFLAYTLLVIASPIAESLGQYNSYENQGDLAEIVVVQPNIDPYKEKFADSENFIPFEKQVQRFVELSKSKITDKTKLVIWPETAIDSQFDETALEDYSILDSIRAFRNSYSHIALLTGITTFQFYPEGTKSTSSRYAERYDLYYDIYNTALFINQKDQLQTYHKSKLVPGVEIMPYPAIFGFLQDLSIDLGGTSGGFGRQSERTVFETYDGLKIAPAICYESIYGDFMSNYMRNNANMIAIITNDGWWGDTPGYHQHNSYAKLRAIEFRKSIARSANTGISGFFDQKGNEIIQTEYWKEDVISYSIQLNNEHTVYADWGDYLGRIGGFVAVAMFLSAFVKGKTTMIKKPKS